MQLLLNVVSQSMESGAGRRTGSVSSLATLLTDCSPLTARQTCPAKARTQHQGIMEARPLARLARLTIALLAVQVWAISLMDSVQVADSQPLNPVQIVGLVQA